MLGFCGSQMYLARMNDAISGIQCSYAAAFPAFHQCCRCLIIQTLVQSTKHGDGGCRRRRPDVLAHFIAVNGSWCCVLRAVTGSFTVLHRHQVIIIISITLNLLHPNSTFNNTSSHLFHQTPVQRIPILISKQPTIWGWRRP